MKISVIGAGLGGLSSACLLAVKGHQVSVFEKNATVGGKMNRFEADGFRFDTGPSLLTMPEILQKLFEACKTDLSSHLDLVPLDPLCKYFYQDGTIFKNYSDRSLDLKEVENIAPQEVKAYSDFLTYSESLYKKTAPAFIFNPLFSIKDLRNLDLLSFFAIDAFTSVSNRVDSKFQSPYLRRFFKRFSTYNGSSPFQAPATLNVIPHVELNTGAFYVKGGLYKIAEALHNLALSLGVKFHFESEIEQIMVEGKKVEGVQLKSGFKEFSDLIIANSDTTETILNLIPGKSISPRKKKKMATIEPSCSGFVLMLGINKKYEQLEHHNLFFSDNYEREFEQIFKEKVMPDDPTIYIASTSHSDQNHAPAGSSNLFILVNAPYLS
ncbi:MAG: phytoene desaturase family protein, partial [Balneolaceae bacterium]